MEKLPDFEMWGTLIFAAIAATMIISYLLARPPFGGSTKLWLLAALGVFPIAAAGTGNLAGFKASKTVDFCASCHLMSPYVNDARDPESKSLAARHTRIPRFGGDSCYTCHENYGMFGTVTTKMDGMKHMYVYYSKYRGADPEKTELKLYEPFTAKTCMTCHSTTGRVWLDNPEHQTVVDDVRKGTTSCVDDGCHGPAHGVKGREPGS